MTDFSVRSDNVDVEQIMGQIRARIREKRGVDYTEDEIRELAKVKLEKFLDPRGVRSDLLSQFRKTKAAMPPAPSYTFEDTSLFESHRGFLRFIRKLLKPILMLFFNVNRLSQALHIQAQLNTRAAQREELDSLHYELMHNLVLETTRLGIEVKNLKMRLESMSSRLDLDERRARALEGVVQYRPGAVPPLQPPTGSAAAAGSPGSSDRERPLTEAEQAERRSRRRRRRGRRRPGEGCSAPEGRNGGTSSAGRDDSAVARTEEAASYAATTPAPVREDSSVARHEETASSDALSPGPTRDGSAVAPDETSAGYGETGSSGFGGASSTPDHGEAVSSVEERPEASASYGETPARTKSTDTLGDPAPQQPTGPDSHES